MEREVWLVVGLGNPGQKYAATRHNVGFDIITVLEKRWQVTGWRVHLNGWLAETNFGDKRVVLCRPQTYMNASGDCIAQLMHWYHVPAERLMVLCDDIDLPQGRLRLRKNGSAGTHNGLRSIIPVAGNDFCRLRVGVGGKPDGWNLADWVLARYSAQDRAVMDEAFSRAADAVEDWLEHGIDHAMNQYNRAK